MKILVINGPNINMLGLREPEIYGNKTYDFLLKYIKDYCDKINVEVEFFQSNHEGAIVDKIQESYQKIDGIVINTREKRDEKSEFLYESDLLTVGDPGGAFL